MNIRSVSDGHRDILIGHGAAYGRLVGSVASDGGRCYIIFWTIIQSRSVVVDSGSLITINIMYGQVVAVDIPLSVDG